MSDKTNKIKFGEWVVRQRIPEGDGVHRLLLLLHGWTGDEDSMWIFTPRLPSSYLILAPRGLTETHLGGYGWEKVGSRSWPGAADFQEAIEALFGLIHSVSRPGLQNNQIDLIGFSQGAALAYTMLLEYPEKINKLAGLSGFLPAGLEQNIFEKALSGKKVFVSHGTKDGMVPIEQGRIVVRELKSAGADVIYCEEDVGHKLSLGCFRAMDAYFERED
ncbi:MAG: alpha/beta hydrolase [Anaerolineales bacterium]|jgi:phospholipase/carboxylesterase